MSFSCPFLSSLLSSWVLLVTAPHARRSMRGIAKNSQREPCRLSRFDLSPFSNLESSKNHISTQVAYNTIARRKSDLLDTLAFLGRIAENGNGLANTISILPSHYSVRRCAFAWQLAFLAGALSYCRPPQQGHYCFSEFDAVV